MQSPTSPKPKGASLTKRVLVGRAVASSGLEHTLLPKILALPVFSSDALSSVAYATEEILHVLLGASLLASHFVMPIAAAIASLMIIVVVSYRQTVKAYPSGGGAYIVSKENLGMTPGLVAAAALLIDYILTVSVSIAAGVFAIYSAAPGLKHLAVPISIGLVIMITVVNLRGVKESGSIFAVPTYAFIASVVALIGIGLFRCLGGCPLAEDIVAKGELATTVGPLSAWVVLRAFSSGATALTGVEAISNGVPAFRRPQSKNASETLAIMGVIAVSMFLGISFLASRMQVTVSEERSVLAQIAHATFGGGIGFVLVQIFTASILVLAANTSYQDFPRLASILARDRFLPRQFSNRGDRLVFSNGVVVLAVFSCLLLWLFDADVNKLVQLYVVGVFTSFTLSQSGMVRHWLAERHKGEGAAKGWRASIVINAIGALATGVVLVVVTATKFSHGAYIVIIAIPVIVFMFRSIHSHYEVVKRQLRRETITAGVRGTNHVVLLVRDIDSSASEALGYVRAIRPLNLRPVFPVTGAAMPDDVQERWRALAHGMPDLEPIPIKGSDLLGAMRAFISGLDRSDDDFVTVIVPELIEEGMTAYLLRKRALIRLKAGLLREPNVVVADVPVAGDSELQGDRSLIPQRTVALVFVSSVHDATIRAVNYAQSLGAAETRAIYFELDPDEASRIEADWFDKRLGIPLDVVEAPFRDLTGPMIEEVRRFTVREDTLVSVVVPEFVVRKWRHLLLHNQNALFVKRLMLFEERVVLSSVPFVLADPKELAPARG